MCVCMCMCMCFMFNMPATNDVHPNCHTYTCMLCACRERVCVCACSRVWWIQLDSDVWERGREEVLSLRGGRSYVVWSEVKKKSDCTTLGSHSPSAHHQHNYQQHVMFSNPPRHPSIITTSPLPAATLSLPQ